MSLRYWSPNAIAGLAAPVTYGALEATSDFLRPQRPPVAAPGASFLARWLPRAPLKKGGRQEAPNGPWGITGNPLSLQAKSRCVQAPLVQGEQ